MAKKKRGYRPPRGQMNVLRFGDTPVYTSGKRSPRQRDAIREAATRTQIARRQGIPMAVKSPLAYFYDSVRRALQDRK
jgi:hypothetical protein